MPAAVLRGTRRQRLAAVLAIVAGTVAAAVPSAAQDRCDGVWVVVDATALGGDVTTRCAAGDPSSGLAALQAAGHRYEFVPRQPGLVCTIDGRPDPCNGAPSDAYWSYWHAPAGGSWTYSTRGAGNRDPEPGTAEGWSFGAGDPPSRQPPAAAPAPGPEPDPEPTPSPSPAAPAPERRSAPATSPPDRPDQREEPAPTGGGPADAASPTPGTEGDADAGDGAAGAVVGPAGDLTTTASSPPVGRPAPTPSPVGTAAEEPAAAPEPDSGAPVGLIVAGLLVVAIAGAGAVRSRRGDGRA